MTPRAENAQAAAVAARGPRHEFAVINRVRFHPAPGREQTMLGGRFTGSNESPRTGFVVLAEIKSVPPVGQWSELRLDNSQPYRWVRYEGPKGSHCNIAELVFYDGDRLLKGQGFGTSGMRGWAPNWARAIDGKLDTFYDSDAPNGQFVGVDLLDWATARRPVLTPPAGEFGKPVRIFARSEPRATPRPTPPIWTAWRAREFSSRTPSCRFLTTRPRVPRWSAASGPTGSTRPCGRPGIAAARASSRTSTARRASVTTTSTTEMTLFAHGRKPAPRGKWHPGDPGDLSG
ncbi:MAG: hypothetical protein M1457_11760, partial [bacterium]|nr:hypothetical protein [bacterium]